MSGNWSSQSPERQAINDYSFTGELVRKDWAWETLRRNPHYRASWLEALPYFEIVAETDHRKVVIAHKIHSALDRWGCLYTDEPSVDARSAAVFWQPEKMVGMLRMTSHTLNAKVDAGCFSLDEMQIPSVLLLMPERKQSVLFLDSGRGLQVSVSGESLRQPALLSADAVPGQWDYKRQIKSLACFNDLRVTGHLIPCHYLKSPDSARLRDVIRALDCSLAGMSWEEIATTLFGEEAVRKEWRDPNRCLYQHTHRLVKRGRELMNGGYLRFLK